MVFAERQTDRATSSVLRLATEAGVEDLSTSDVRRLRVTIQVQAPENLAVQIPGCAVRPFRAPDLDVTDFSVSSITEDPDIIIDSALPADPDARALSRVPVTVPGGANQLVRITVVASRATLGEDEIGLRLDASPQALPGGRCTEPIDSTNADYVEFYLLPGELIETGGVAVAAGAALVALIILLTLR